MADDLFRKSALDKLASPERLDVLMRVTSPKGWAALWAIGGVLVAVVAWSILGSLPERIEGQGELIRGGGTLRITASGDGVLSKLDLKVDQNVKADQIVGEITGVLVDEARNNTTDVARRNAARAETTKTEISQVKATVPGRVIEIVKREGERVRIGEVVATIEPLSTDMEAVIYVASASGKRIKPSMEVQLSPTTVKREEYGFMKGMVTRVGDYAATPESVRAVLGNDALVKEFLEGGSKFELRVLPTVDSKTRSGFAWSSSGGPPEKIGTGTKVTVAVIVDRHPPIVEVLPFLKSIMGSS